MSERFRIPPEIARCGLDCRLCPDYKGYRLSETAQWMLFLLERWLENQERRTERRR